MKITKKEIKLLKAKVKCIRAQHESNLSEARLLLEDQIELCGGKAAAVRFLGIPNRTCLINPLTRKGTDTETVLKWVEKFLPDDEKK